MALKLITDKGNYESLKVVVASGVLNTDLFIESFEKSGLAERCDHQPLVHMPGLRLFSMNSAVKYMFERYGKQDIDSVEVDQLLKWEANQFQPVVSPYLITVLGHGKKYSVGVAQLKNCLRHLDLLLSEEKYFVKGRLSSVDVVIWSALYPLIDKGPSTISISEFSNLSSWYTSLSGIDAFQAGVLTVTGGNGVIALKEYFAKFPLPSSPSSKLPKNMSATNKQRPQSQCQSLTESVDKMSIDAKRQKPSSGQTDSSETTEGPIVSQEELQSAMKNWSHGLKGQPSPRAQTHPKRPIAGERNILITSALPYVNNVPHLGNIIGCVLSGDVYSRFCRLRNYNSLFLCGTDEYGTATETKGLAEGLTPEEICTKYNKLHTEVYKWFNIDFDYFGRTTTEWQTKIAQDIFWKLYNNGYILKDSVEQLKCDACDRFLADRFVEGVCPLCKFEDARGDQCDGCGKLLNATDLLQPRCKICSRTPGVKSSDHLFLDLPRLTDQLSSFLDTRFTEESLWSPNAKLITKSWLRDGLKPRCITRDLKWGTPVPLEGYTDKVFYVWFDAPIGYLSIGANYDSEWERWWKNPSQVELFNFLGKDNVPFHSVIFPASLIGSKEPFTLVSHISATEYLNYEDTKFSKSRGTGVFGDHASQTDIPADIWRFYLLFIRPESQDTNFSWDDFLLKNNSELLNNIGNFINRSLMFVYNNFSATIPEIILTQEDNQLLALVTRELKGYVDDLEHLRLRDGIRRILSISRLGNQFMQANQPWVLVKQGPEQKARGGSVVGICANISCLLSVLLQPYMPQVSSTIQQQLAAPSTCNVITENFVCYLAQGHKINKPSPLFKKLEASYMEELKKKYAGKPVDVNSKNKKPTGSVDKQPPKSATVSVNSVNGIASLNTDELNTKITEQGNIVREMKTAKADKATIQVEVDKLLALKKEFALVTGQAPEPTGSKKKGKNKKK